MNFGQNSMKHGEIMGQKIMGQADMAGLSKSAKKA